jgi:hypothetical protein
VRGVDIKLVSDAGGIEPHPIVLPPEPLDLVLDDCEGLALFSGGDNVADRDSRVLVMYWLEEGERSRSLTILANSPSCRAHEKVNLLNA